MQATKRISFYSFEDLLNVIKISDISDFWKMETENQVIAFMNLTLFPYPFINASIIINNALNVTACIKIFQITTLGKFVFPAHCKSVNELHDILHLVQDLTLPTTQSNDGLVCDSVNK